MNKTEYEALKQELEPHVQKLFRRHCPKVTINRSNLDVLAECTLGFIELMVRVTGEESDAAGSSQMGGEHLISALEKHHFDDILPEVKERHELLEKINRERIAAAQ